MVFDGDDFIDHGDPRIDAAWMRLMGAVNAPPACVPSDEDGTLLEEFYAAVPGARDVFNI